MYVTELDANVAYGMALQQPEERTWLDRVVGLSETAEGDEGVDGACFAFPPQYQRARHGV